MATPNSAAKTSLEDKHLRKHVEIHIENEIF